ncbi:MAG: uracil-DNA glycosylase [Campylobacterales bacterium]
MNDLERLKRLRELYWREGMGERYIDPPRPSPVVYHEKISESLEELRQEVMACHLCDLSKSRRHIVFGEGNPAARLMFIGEAPGASEDEEGRPFCGRSGAMLTDMIRNVLRMQRSEVYITNILKCRPPLNRTPTEEEAHLCRPWLFRQIEIIKPQLMLLLGATALRYLFNETLPVSKARGRIWDYRGIKVVVTYHPSYLLRNPSAKKETLQDLLLLKSLL